MHQFGVTRGVRRRDHAVFTADTFVRAALPGMRKDVAIIHAAPAIGAAFTQYTAELESGGCLGELPTSCERFIYVIEGRVTADFSGQPHALTKNDYAYIPQQLQHSITAVNDSKLAVIEKRYLSLDGVRPPAAFAGRTSAVSSEPLAGDATIAVGHLLPGKIASDCPMHLLTYTH